MFKFLTNWKSKKNNVERAGNADFSKKMEKRHSLT